MSGKAPTRSALTSGSIAALVKGELAGPATLEVTGIAAIGEAGPGSLTFIRSRAFSGAWATSRATVALVSRGVEVPSHDPKSRALIVVPDADAALSVILAALAPPAVRPRAGVHASAVVEPGANVDPSACIGPQCTVFAGASIGPGAVLMASVTVGAGASIGEGSILHPNVVVAERCRVGAHCIVHPNAVIGADGFGYAPDPERGLAKIPHIGDVVLGDYVEVGAATCIDRAKFGSTVIGEGTKIDNLVQIAHNCRIGKCCLICGQCGLSGSVTLGDGVILAGSVGVADGLSIGAGARIGASSGVLNDIPAGETWYGTPAMPGRDAARNYAAFRDLANQLRELRRMQKVEVSGTSGGSSEGS